MALIAHYPLNGDTKDYSGYGNDGVSTGAVVSNTGKIGGSYKFDGVTSGVNIPSVNYVGMEVYSMAAWVKPLGNHKNYNGVVISSGNWNSAAWNFGLSQDNSKIDVASNRYNRYLDYPVPVGEWTHIVCVAENNVTKVYVNGNYVGQINAESKLTSNAANTYIGRETYASGYFAFNGELNDIRIYDHALSDKEVKEIAKAKVLHYKFDEHDLITQLVKDSSGFRNDGTITLATAPTWSEDSPVGRGSMVFERKYIDLPNLIGNTQEVTVSVWYKSKGIGGGGYHVIMGGAALEVSMPNSGQARVGMIIDGTRRVHNYPSNLTDGRWHNICALYDGSKQSIYVDGVLAGSTPYSGSLNNNFLRRIGVHGAGTNYYANGNIADVRIYATALSPEDILELYQTRASLDNEGNLFVQEIDEMSPTLKSIDSRGIASYMEFNEVDGDNKMSIGDDGVVYVNEIMEA